MNEQERLGQLRSELRDELVENLLPFWMGPAVDEEYGGFHGRIARYGDIVPDADKGSVLNARILWTFAAAHALLGGTETLAMARRAFDYFIGHFVDREYGGIYWTVDRTGRPAGQHKQTYAQAFAIFGLSEYHRVASRVASHGASNADSARTALEEAIEIFRVIEDNCYDRTHGGYTEAFGRAWEPLHDMRLSEKDVNAPKNVNTHLHVLEAYASLYRVWPDPLLGERLAELIRMFVGQPFLEPDSAHLIPFFETDWTVASRLVSFGHDIEASWLVHEAAIVLGDAALQEEATQMATAVATATLSEGQEADGGIAYEVSADGRRDSDRHWWVQAEAIVGFVNAYQISGDERFLGAAEDVWEYTREFVVDEQCGEWYGRVGPDGTAYEMDDKVGLWKCPYHNGRACINLQMSGLPLRV